MQQETLERLENVVDLLKQGDINITQGGEEAHHKAYQRRAKSGKMEQVKQKGAIPAKGEKLQRPEKGGKQEAGAVLGGDEHQAFKGMLDTYFNNQKELRDLTTRISNLKVASEETMKNIRPLLAKFENIDKAEDKYRVEFKEGDWDYKFLSFTRETQPYKELYTKAFDMLNDLQRKEMQEAEKALKTITAQEKFERTSAEKAMRYSTLVKTYVGKPLTEETMEEFTKEVQMMISLNKALMAGGTPAGTSGVGVKKRSTDEDEDEKDKKKKKKAKGKVDAREFEDTDDDEEKDEKKAKGKEFKDEKEPKKDKDSAEHEKFINKLEDGGDEDDKDEPDKESATESKEGKGAGGDEKATTGKNGKAYEKLAASLENLIALKQRGVKLMRHMFERKDAHGYKPKNSEAVEKDKKDKEEKSKSLLEVAVPIVAMKFSDVLEKARSHKYLRRLGGPKHYQYIYHERVRVSEGSGIDSGKIGVIIDPREVRTDHRGIPIDVQGAYKPVDWKNEVAIKLDNGKIITMFKNRVSKVEGKTLKMEGAPKFDFGKMKKLIESDAFLKHQFNRMPGTPEHKAQVLFNSEVVGDSVMMRAYEGDPEIANIKAQIKAHLGEGVKIPKRFKKDQLQNWLQNLQSELSEGKTFKMEAPEKPSPGFDQPGDVEKLKKWGDYQRWLKRQKVESELRQKFGGVFEASDAPAIVENVKKNIRAPFVSAQVSTLGGKDRASLMITVSLQKKEDWTNGILQNSPYMMFHIGRDGKMEQFSGIKDAPTGKRFRATKVKNVQDAIDKINAHINRQPVYPSKSKTPNLGLDERRDHIVRE